MPTLLPLVIALMTGIWWQTNSCIWYIIIPAISIPFFIPQNIKYKYSIALYTIAFSVGVIASYQQQSRFWAFYHEFEGKNITLEGVITDITKTQNKHYPYQIALSIKKVNQKHNSKKINSHILICTQTNHKYHVSDTIKINNVTIKKPQSESFTMYMIRSKINSTIFVSLKQITLLTSPKYSIAKALWNIKNKLKNELEQKLSPVAYTLFTAVFLGSKSDIKKQLNELKVPFKTWGILHFLARSGLHLIIFLILIEYLLRYIPCTFGIKQLLSILLATLYYLFSWPTLSFVRAFTTFALYKICIFIKQPIHPLHLVILTMGITLLINPILLFALDFQLSFGIALAITWFRHLQMAKSITIQTNH